ncbi:hypothetical protein D9M68_1000970 [compost metagenome]
MLENIVDAFLGNAKQGDLRVARQARGAVFGPVHRQARIAQAIGLLVHGFVQAEIIQYMGAQAADQLPAFADAALGQVEDALQLVRQCRR